MPNCFVYLDLQCLLLFIGYHRVGNSCTKCPGLAWPAVALGVFLVLTIIAVVINGFTESVCTKVINLLLKGYYPVGNSCTK